MPYLWGYRTVRSRGKANAHKVSEGGTGTADHKADSLTVYYSDSRLTSFFFSDFKGTTGGLLVIALVCCPSTKQNSSTNSLSRYSILVDFFAFSFFCSFLLLWYYSPNRNRKTVVVSGSEIQYKVRGGMRKSEGWETERAKGEEMTGWES